MASKYKTPKRSEGNAQTSISLKKESLTEGRALAAKDNRTFSNWVEQLIQEKIAEYRASGGVKPSDAAEREEQ